DPLNCIAAALTGGGTKTAYSGNVYTVWQDAYTMNNYWSELAPIAFSLVLPNPSFITTSTIAFAQVQVVSTSVTIEMKPIDIINAGAKYPTLQFTTVATSAYPIAAYGNGYAYTVNGVKTSVPSGSDPSHGQDVCTVTGQQPITLTGTDANTYCTSHGGACTIQFTPAPSVSVTIGTSYDICDTVAATDYTSFISSTAVHGYFDTSSGAPVSDPSNFVGINVPLNFGFRVSLGAANGVSVPAGLKITSAVLTELKITLSSTWVSFNALIASGARKSVFYLVGSSSSQTAGGAGTDVSSVSGLTFNPAASPPIYTLAVSSSSQFATIATTFSPTVGKTGSGSMLNFGDGLVTITIEFVATLTLSAGSGTRRRDVSVSGHVLAARDMNATVSSNVLHLVTHTASATINVPVQDKSVVSSTATGGLPSFTSTGVPPSSISTMTGVAKSAYTAPGSVTTKGSSGVIAEPSNIINSESGGGGGVGNVLGSVIGLAAVALLA
ncbi:hypothetical protein HDU98_001079, partial [Podochytrium sp. JEL0797]